MTHSFFFLRTRAGHRRVQQGVHIAALVAIVLSSILPALTAVQPVYASSPLLSAAAPTSKDAAAASGAEASSTTVAAASTTAAAMAEVPRASASTATTVEKTRVRPLVARGAAPAPEVLPAAPDLAPPEVESRPTLPRAALMQGPPTNPVSVQTYYVPVTEAQALTSMKAINTAAAAPINSYVSIAIGMNATRVYFDHWENGYDSDIANPTNLYATPGNLGGTQAWGNGLCADGFPPNKDGSTPLTCNVGNQATVDALDAGDVIVLRNAIDPTTPLAIDFDGRDKIGASNPIAVSRVYWGDGTCASGSAPGTCLGGAVEVYPTSDWGKQFIAPVGNGLVTLVNSANFASATANTNLAINKPASTAEGDLMVAVLVWENNNPTITAPTGWTQLYTQPYGTDAHRQVAYYKFAGASEPSSYTWTTSASYERAGFIATVRGAGTPTAVTQQNANTANSAAPAVTITQPGDFVLHVGSTEYGATRTGPSNYTEFVDVRSNSNADNLALAGAWRLYTTAGSTGTQTATWSNADNNIGTQIFIPTAVGYNYFQMFEYSSLAIQATLDGTNVTVDINGPLPGGVSTFTMNQGESVVVNNVIQGGTVNANYPVSVYQLTGDINSSYEYSIYTLSPTSQWTASLYSPVGTSSPNLSSVSQATIYNPGPGTLDVRCDFRTSSTNINNIPANGTAAVAIPDLSAAHCYAVTGDNSSTYDASRPFFALGTVDAAYLDGDASSGGTWDWGFTLVPDAYLWPQVLVGMGIGQDPNSTSTQNGSPVWVTPVCATGTTSTWLYVDLDGDGAPDKVDLNGDNDVLDNNVDGFAGLDEPTSDQGINILVLQSVEIFDPNDQDQTGLRMWTRTASGNNPANPMGCKLAAAWGEDPNIASTGNPGFDVGTTIPWYPPYSVVKSSAIAVDGDNNGVVSPGDTLTYTIQVLNTSLAALVSLTVSDTVPVSTTYVANSTSYSTNSGATWAPIADSGGTTPLDGGQLFAPLSIGVGATFLVRYQVVVDLNVACGSSVVNSATVLALGGSRDATSIDPIQCPSFNSPELEIGKSVTPLTSVRPGDEILYTLNVTNTGSLAASNVIVREIVPANTTFVSASAPGSHASGIVTWSGLTIPIGGSITLTFRVQADSPWPSFTPPITNTATLTYTDFTSASPSSAFSKTVTSNQTTTPVRQISITKSVVSPPGGVAAVGQNILYNLTVRNTGNIALSTIPLQDVFDSTCLAYVSSADPATSVITPTISWSDIGALSPGAAKTIAVTLRATGECDAAQNIARVVGAIAEDGATVPTAQDEETVRITPIADVTVTKYSTQTTAVAGQLLTYTVTASNNGPSEADSVVVSDTIPAYTTFVSASAGCAETPPASGVVVCSAGALQPAPLAGSSASFRITVLVSPSAPPGGSLINTAIVRTTTAESNYNNNSDTETDPVVGQADMAVTKTGPVTATAGGLITYVMVARNNGPSVAQGVNLGDSLPPGVTLQSLTVVRSGPGPTTCVGTNCALGSVAVGEVITATLVGLVGQNVSGAFTNTVSVVSLTPDPVPSNNQDDHPTTVSGLVRLRIDKWDLLDPVGLGEALVYEVRVTNLGPSAAQNVVVSDTIDSRLTYQSNTDACVEGPIDTLTCTLGTIASGSYASFFVTTIAPAYALSGTVVYNNATASSTTPLHPSSVLTDSADTTIIHRTPPPIDLEIVKSFKPTPSVVAGNLLTYTLAITNHGPAVGTNVRVVDVLPSGVTVISMTPSQGVCTVGPDCSLGTLAVGGTASIRIVVRVGANQAGNVLQNLASVSSDETDVNPPNNTSVVNTPVVGIADLEAFKRVDRSPAVAGEPLQYTLVITNHGPSNAANVTVSDVLPGVLQSPTVSSNPGGCTALPCVFPTLAAGQSASVTVIGTVIPSASGSLVNTVSVTSTTPLTNTANDVYTITTPISTITDLSIAMASPPTVVAGDSMTVTATIRNLGPSSAQSPVVTVTLPASVTLDLAATQAALPAGWTVAPGPNGTVVFHHPTTFPVGSNVALPIVVDVDPSVLPGTTLLFEGEVQTPTPESNYNNNTDDTPTTVVAISEVGVVKTGPASVLAGSLVTFTVVITNAGPSDATGVNAVDLLPPGLSIDHIDVERTGPALAACAGILCNLGTVEVGEEVTLTVVALVGPYVTGTVTNTVEVISVSYDPDLSNNKDDHPILVQMVSTLVIDKTDSPDPVPAGGTLTYVLAVTNQGPSAAHNVVISDTLPPQFTPISIVSSPSGCTALPCNVGTVPAGGSASVTIVGKVASGATNSLNNTAYVTTTTPLGPGSDLEDTEPTSLVIVADLSIDLTSPPTVIAGDDMTVTAVVRNLGPSDAVNAVVTVTLPASVTVDLTATNAALPPGWSAVDNGDGTLTITKGNGPFVVGALFTLPIVVETDPAIEPGTQLEFDGEILSDTPEINYANNVDTTRTVVVGLADLSLVKSGRATVTAGNAISYTMVVRNAGPSVAQAASVNDVVPAGITGISITGVRTGAGAITCAGATCALGDVAVGEVITLTLNGIVDASVAVPGVLNNVATVTSPTADPIPGNNTDNHPTTLAALSRLTIEKRDLMDPVGLGETLVYAIVVHNYGPSTARSVVVTDTLDSLVTYQDNTDSCVENSGVLTCSLGDIVAGGESEFLVTVVAPMNVVSGTQVLNTVVVTTPTPLDPTSVLSDTEPTIVVERPGPPADLAIRKSATPTPTVVAGELLTYTLVVTNYGTATANNVMVVDALPPGTTYVSATPSQGSCAGALLCSLGTLEVYSVHPLSATAEITVVVRVGSHMAGQTLINTAQVSSDRIDDHPENNVSTVSTPVVGRADLVISKIDLQDPVTAGTHLTYRVLVRNLGPSDAHNLVVTDTLPVSTTYVSNTDGCTASGNTLTCPQGSLASGGSTSFEVTVLVGTGVVTGTILHNTVELTSTTPVGPNSVLEDEEPTRVVAQTDLSIDVSAPPTVIAGESMTVTAVVRNLGPSDAQNAVVTVTLPASVTADIVATNAALPPGWSAVDNGDGTLTFSKTDGPFEVGDLFTLPIVVDTDPAIVPGTILTFVGDILSDTPEVNYANNTDSAPTLVMGLADVIVVKDGMSTVVAGTGITWTVIISNAGPSTAQAVALMDVVPPGVSAVSLTLNRNGNLSPCTTTCFLGDIAVGERLTVTVHGTVNPNVAAGSVLTNTASAQSPTRDPNPDNNSDTHPTTVLAQSRIEVSKRDLSDPATAGGLLSYEVRVRNFGPSDAQNVVVTDTLPLSTTFVSSTGSCVQGSPGVITCAVGTVAAGATTAFQVTVLVAASVPAGTTLINRVVLTTTTPVGPGSVLTDTEPTTVTTITDLAIDLSSPPNVVAGKPMTVTAVVRNNGPSDAVNAVVTVTLPASVTADIAATNAALPPGWNAVDNGDGTLTITKTDGPFEVGDSFTLPIVVDTDPRILPGTQLEFEGEILSDTPENNYANNVDTTRTAVIGVADVIVVKTGGTTVKAGAPVTFTIQVRNAGPSTARAVNLQDVVPAGITGASLLVQKGPSLFACGTVCLLGDMLVGEVVTVTVLGTVGSQVPGGTILDNVASATSPTPDPVPSNNSDNHPVTVVTEAQIVISKRDLTDPVRAGDNLTYEVIVRNLGPSDALNVAVTDTLPVSTTYVSNTGGCTVAGNVLSCAMGTVTAGGQKSFQVTVKVLSSVAANSTLHNVAVVTTTTPIGPGSVLTTTEPTNVRTETDLAIQVDAPPTVIAGHSMPVTVTTTNLGPSDAVNAVVTVTLPASVTLDLAATNAGLAGTGWVAVDNGDGTLTLHKTDGPFEVGDAFTLPVVVDTDPRIEPGTVLQFVGVVDSDTPETLLSNNVDDAETTVIAEADLGIIKTGPVTVTAGTYITWTLVVNNYGPSSAHGAFVVDAKPLGVTLVGITGVRTGPGTVDCAANICQMGTVQVGELITLTAVGLVDPGVASGTVLNNSAWVSSLSRDPNPANNSDSHPTTVRTLTELVIAKHDLIDPATAGQPLTYEVVVTNNGPSHALNVVVTDTIPSGTTYVSNTNTPSCTQGPVGMLTCSLGTITAGANKSFQVTVDVASSVVTGTTLLNSVRVRSTTPVAPTSVLTDTEPTQVKTLTDLALQLSAPGTTVAGTPLTVTATVQNNGPSDAVQAVVTVTLPASVTGDIPATNAALAGSGWVASAGPNNAVILSKTDGPFLVGDDFTLPIVTHVNSNVEPGTSLQFHGIILSQTPESTYANNPDTVDVSVVAVADAGVTKTGPATATAGETVAFTVVVTNAGPSTAQSVHVIDVLPPGLSLVSVTVVREDGAPVSCSTANCLIGDVQVGSHVTVTVVGLVAASVPEFSALSNVVRITTTGSTDPVPANNDDTHPFRVTALTELVVTKRDLEDPATAGANLTYEMVVTNNGPSDAQSVVVSDTVPAGTTYVSSNGTCSAVGSTVTCSLGKIAADASKSVQITVLLASSLPASTVLTNNVSITSTTPVSPSSVLTDAEPTTLRTQADLALVMAAPATTIAGTQLVVTTTVNNLGPSDAVNAVVTVTLPASVTLDITTTNSLLPAGWVGTDNHDGTLTLHKVDGPFVVGDQFALPIATLVDSNVEPGTSLQFHGVILSDTPEVNLANNPDDVDVSVVGLSNLVLDKTGALTATAGTPISYTIVVTNGGPSTAQSVDVKDTLPAGVNLTSATVQRTGSGASACAGQGTICQVGDMSLGEVVTITVYGVVDSSVVTGTVLTNLATVFSDSMIGPSSHVSDTHPTTVEAVATLSVLKRGMATVVAGTQIAYEIVVSNAGPSDARSVVVSDTLPAGLTQIVGTVGGDANACSVSGTQLTCTIAAVPAGQSRSVQVTAQVPSGATGSLRNYAAADSPDSDPALSPPITTTVDTAADLLVIKRATPTTSAGRSVEYTLTVTNLGPSDAQNVVVSDTLPLSVTFVSASPECGQTAANSHVITCTAPSLVAGASVAFRLTVLSDSAIEPGTSIENVAVVSSSTRDTNPTNNASNADTSIVGLADMQLVKNGPEVVVAGDLVTYTIHGFNAGPSMAKAVDIKDQLPPGVTLEQVTADRSGTGNAVCGGAVCQFGDVAQGEQLTVTVVARVDPDVTGTLTNTAGIFSSTPDPDLNNNVDNVPSVVETLAKIVVEKSDDIFDPAPPGSPVAYAIEVRNEGPSDAQDVVIVDTLPAGMTYLSSRPSVCTEQAPGHIVCSLGRLRAGDTKLFQVFVRISMQVAGGTVLRNIVSVETSTPTTPDSKLQDVEDTLVEEPSGPPADLEIVKTAAGAVIEPGQPFTYTLVVTNKGPQTAKDVKVLDVVPPGLTVVSVTANQGFCIPGVICLLGNVAPNTSVTIRVVVLANENAIPGTNQHNEASVISDSPDPEPGNNQDVTDTPAGPIVAITIEKVALARAAQVGKEVKYDIIIYNAGPSTAPNVAFTDTLPTGMGYIGATPLGACTPITSQVIRCSVGSMPPNTSRTVRMTVSTESAQAGTHVNVVELDIPGVAYTATVALTDTASVSITTDPTAIVLENFVAAGTRSGITVYWNTAIEFNTYGFYLWRSTTPNFGTASRITADLLPAQGGQGAAYSYLDEAVDEGVTYYYWLEEVEMDDARNFNGPVNGTKGALFSNYLPVVER